MNIAALRDFASRCAADTTTLPGCSATLRECIFYILHCVGEQYSNELGLLTVMWHEASTLQEQGIATRRYSGAAPFLDDRETFTGGAL